MPWIISKVDNIKREYQIKRHCGALVDVTVPAEHDILDYIKTAQRTHEALLSTPKKVGRVKQGLVFVGGIFFSFVVQKIIHGV